MKQTCHKLLGGGNKHNANILEVVARGGGVHTHAPVCVCMCMRLAVIQDWYIGVKNSVASLKPT